MSDQEPEQQEEPEQQPANALPTEEEVLDAVRTLYSETPVESAGLARAAAKLYAFARGHWDISGGPSPDDPEPTVVTTNAAVQAEGSSSP